MNRGHTRSGLHRRVAPAAHLLHVAGRHALSASFIGWDDSPFQFEVATASLGFAAVGFLAASRSFDLRLAAIVGPGLFTLGAAAGHVREMISQQNFAPGNAGVIFYRNIAIPLFGLALLHAARSDGRHRSTPPRPR